MWPFHTPAAISYRCFIVTKCVSPAVFEIILLKNNWVTTLTFWSHVTSSVVWPFDSPYPISYWSSIVTKCVSPFSSRFRDISPHDFDLSRSRYDIGHVYIRFAISHFLLVVNWYRTSISYRFRDICIFLYLGHDLHLLGSRDVIGHVTIRLPIPHFLFVLHCDQVCISSRVRDIQLQSACMTSANRHCACAISRNLYPLCKIWVHILISHPHIAYSPWHFDWAPMKIKGCLLLRPQC